MTVFLSHSRQNGGAALKLGDQLTQLGVEVWLDLRELEAGGDWQARVSEAIRSSSGFVFLIGPAAEPDQGQRFEWQQITEQEFYLDPSKTTISSRCFTPSC